MEKDSERQNRGERREDFGSEEVTQLPDHVIAERRCQNAAEEEKSMHVRQRGEDEEEAEGRKKDKRRRETKEVSLEASRSYWRARLSRANPQRAVKKNQDQCPPSQRRQVDRPSVSGGVTETNKTSLQQRECDEFTRFSSEKIRSDKVHLLCHHWFVTMLRCSGREQQQYIRAA